MKPLTVETIVGQGVLFPRGHVRITLSPQHRRAYLLLYGEAFPLADVPALKDRDFDGRSITMSARELASLNHLFHDLAYVSDAGPPGTFRDQERSLTKTSGQAQFLS